MATTSIWAVKGWLGKVVLYIENPDKTDNPKFYRQEELTDVQTQSLSDVIDYAVRAEKTTVTPDDESAMVVRQFISGINCLPSTARDEMLAVKKRFGKEDGVIAYHGYQSFAPGEATPELAHEIGVKLAQRLWGERYQVLVATHLDKENHLHNHFVLNTVSFVDGIKYHRTEKDYHDMRTVSDTLCREYNLSVIQRPQAGKSKHYGEWRAEQEQRPTWRGLIRSEIDELIRQSVTEKQFYYLLRQKGYEVKFGKDISVRPPGKERFVRLTRNFGEAYTAEAIRQRILQQPLPQPERQMTDKPRPKTYAKPCLYEACLSPQGSSFVCLDPKGELLRDSGRLLEESGYEIRVLDLLHMEKSHCYNPFVYLTNDNEVQMLVTNLFKATTPKGAQSQDPFWDSTASILLSALVYYLYHEAPPEEQNFPMVMEMLRAGEVREDDDSYLSPLDVLFERLEMRDPEHIAVKYYKQYRSGSAKTLKSIQITLASHMEKFNLDSLIALTATDELHLQDMGEKRVALFALIPDSDTSFNFLVSILYQQLFQQLFDSADHKHGGSLPVPVHFLMDEFANISLPNDFEIKLSTMRSRNVFVSIILQNIAQLKALFEKQWESILGNCDELLYLGGNEQGSHKYISELLGKATIDTNTYGRSSGRNGNYSTNYQITGRELMTPDEVRMLDNGKALLFIRGELPVCDDKFDIMTHPLVSHTPDGGAPPYIHGSAEYAIAAITIHDRLLPTDPVAVPSENETQYELLSNEELEAIYELEEKPNEASQKH